MAEEIRLGGDWTLHGASATAVRYDGVPITRSGLTLRILEGRGEQLHPSEEPDKYLTVLAYELAFSEADAKESDNSEQSEGAIVLAGSMSDGRPCKIWGDGYIGEDNLGQIEGSFWKAPRIELIQPEEPFASLSPDDEPGELAAHARR
jgi:hypothetical protein